MKLTTDLTEYIENVVRTASIVNIDGVIIDAESGTVRGIDEERTVVLFQDTNVPNFPTEINMFGLSRGSIFCSRLDIVKGREGFNVDAEVVELDDGIKYVKALHMKSADTKVGYRCANPDSIKAPKQINDTIVHRIQLTAEAVSVLQKGHGGMGTETVVIASGDGVAFELEDISEDAMRHVFAEESIQLGENSSSTFSHKYPIKTLLALFKEIPDGYFEIGEKGILRVVVNNLNIYVLPQV